MNKDLNLCMKCMNELSEDGSCSNCGMIEKNPVLPCFLVPHTTINDRYLVGDVVTHNGESITYIGYDKTLFKKVYIKEFMPQNMCCRDNDTDDINVFSEYLVRYKNHLAEFTELNRFLMKMRSLTHIVSVSDIVSENNTVYSISDFAEGITLKDYIMRNGNILSWTDIKAFLPPILTTLSLIHNSGRCHLGISPETIIFTNRGEVKITGFCITDERLTNSCLVPELFSGYSAPEQYEPNIRVGKYSDVYAICAVIYRAVTGITPPESIVRTIDDNLKSITDVNTTIPSEVTAVIKAGMNVNVADRIQTVSELVTKLFEQPKYFSENEKKESNVQKKSHKNTQIKKSFIKKDNKKNTNKKTFKYKFAVIAFLVSLVILIPVLILLIWLVLGADNTDTNSVDDNTVAFVQERQLIDEEYSDEEASETKAMMMGKSIEEGNNLELDSENVDKMPNLIGLDYDSVVKSGKATKILNIQPEYKFSDDYAKGIIVSQSIREDTFIEKGINVTITVSKGSSVVKVPDFTGLTQKEYVEILDSLNIKYDVEYMDSYEVLDDYVVHTNKHVGDKIDLLKGDVLIVYIANGMAITSDTVSVTSETIQ